MANVLHANLSGNDLHEPKGVASAAANTVYKANGAGSGTWDKLAQADLDFSDKTQNKFGWNDISDGLYTVGSPRSISASTRTLITNNGAAAQTDTTRLGTLWNTTTNALQINDLNASYMLRINAVVKTTATAGTPYIIDIEVESSNGPTVISARTQVIKGGSYANNLSIVIPFYMGSFINNHDLKLYITADQNITMYNVGFMLQRTYLES